MRGKVKYQTFVALLHIISINYINKLHACSTYFIFRALKVSSLLLLALPIGYTIREKEKFHANVVEFSLQKGSKISCPFKHKVAILER